MWFSFGALPPNEMQEDTGLVPVFWYRKMKQKQSLFNRIFGILLPLLVLATVAGFYIYASQRLLVSMPEISPVDGVADFRGCPLEEQVYHLVNRWDYYPGFLYGPEDFEDPENVPEKAAPGVVDNHLGTYRVKILADPHKYLMLASYSIDYSMRVFVNGEEVRNMGFVSDDPEKTIHDGHYFTIPFFTGEGETEIIYQYANFMHKDGGFIQATTIGSTERIDAYTKDRTLYALSTGGGLLFLAFYFLLYATYQKNREYAILATCCLLMCFRNSHFVNEFLRPENFPFELHYRIFIMSVSMIPTMGIFLPAAYFPDVIPKWISKGFGILCAVSIVLHFTIPTQALVGLCHISYYICLAFLPVVVWLFLRFFFKKKSIDRTELMTVSIIVLLYAAMTWESLNTGHNSLVAHFGMTPFALLVSILGLSVATNIKITRRMELLSEEQSKNRMLEQVNAMNRDFLQTVAHELRTPLSVISGYAQLTQMQIEKGKLSEQTPERLQVIRSEADRLGAMVANLMAYTYGQTAEAELHMVDPSELLKNAALIGEPICEKKGNRLILECESKSMAHGNFELLLQVLINLVANANRHTQDGELRLKTQEDEKYIIITVSDTGSGMTPEVTEHIFERGYSTDGGNGLGLAICMDTVKMHGGEMTLKYTGPEGTAFEIRIPKEGESH